MPADNHLREAATTPTQCQRRAAWHQVCCTSSCCVHVHLTIVALLHNKWQQDLRRALVMRAIMAKTLESGMRVVWMPTRARSRAMRCPVYSGAASATTTCRTGCRLAYARMPVHVNVCIMILERESHWHWHLLSPTSSHLTGQCV